MKLSLAEQILLLGVDDRKGNFLTSYLKYALSGAILTELIEHNRIRVDGKEITALDRTPTADNLLDEALQTIAESIKPHTVKCWIRGSLADHQRERILDRLVQQGILERVEKRVLGIFPYRRYPTHDPAPEEELRRRLRDAASTPSDPPEEVRAVLSIAEACGLTRSFLTKEERQGVKQRLKYLVEQDPVASAIQAAIKDDEAAAAALAATASVNG